MQIKSLPAKQGNNIDAKNPWLAVNLSLFFPGIGQIYAGDSVRGLTLLFVQIVLIAIAAWSLFSPSGNTSIGQGCLLPILLVYIASLYDAYSCVEKQLNYRQSKNISKASKDPWFAVFLSQLLPGLGHFYINNLNFGAFFISLTIVFTTFANSLLSLLIFLALLSAISSYHVYISFPRKRKKAKYYLITIVAVAILTFRLVVTYLPNWVDQQFEVFQIPSESMQPTLLVGDKILVRKSNTYHPRRGDLVVFKEPEVAEKLSPNTDNKKEHFFIKRIVGEPGETIEVKEGAVYINGQPLKESYISEPPKYQWDFKVIPSDYYCVFGDNRNNSFDSHVWGFLQGHYVVGKAYKIFWPQERIRSLLSSN